MSITKIMIQQANNERTDKESSITINELIKLVHKFQLDGCDLVNTLTMEQMARAYNGIGPEWFPDKLRRVISWLHSDLTPAAFIHDLRFTYSDGTYAQFVAVNLELKTNGCKIARALYSWYDPRRYLRIMQSCFFKFCCDTWGSTAYLLRRLAIAADL